MKCYDCGSTIEGRHTALCDMGGQHERHDLPSKSDGNHHWTGIDGFDNRSRAQAIVDCRAYIAANGNWGERALRAKTA